MSPYRNPVLKVLIEMYSLEHFCGLIWEKEKSYETFLRQTFDPFFPLPKSTKQRTITIVSGDKTVSTVSETKHTQSFQELETVVLYISKSIKAGGATLHGPKLKPNKKAIHVVRLN